MKFPNTTILILLTAAVFQSCSSDVKTETSLTTGEKIPVKVMALTQQEISPVVQASGTFTTDDETYLAFKTGGVIEKIFVKEGDAIRKGQILARLNLTEIEAQVSQAKLGLDKALRDYQRVTNLYKDSVATLEQFQNARTAWEVAGKQVEAAQFNRTYSEIKAVSNGYVLRKFSNEGQVITSGTPVFQTNGASQNNWKLRVGLSDSEWAKVTRGDRAIITTDALPGKSLEATVTRKSEGADVMSGALTVELTLTQPTTALATGVFGKAVIEATRKQKLWSIPYEALLDGNAQSGYVFVRSDSNTAKKVAVTVHQITRSQVLISGGLDDVSEIIVSGSAYLREGSAIEIRK